MGKDAFPGKVQLKREIARTIIKERSSNANRIARILKVTRNVVIGHLARGGGVMSFLEVWGGIDWKDPAHADLLTSVRHRSGSDNVRVIRKSGGKSTRKKIPGVVQTLFIPDKPFEELLPTPVLESTIALAAEYEKHFPPLRREQCSWVEGTPEKGLTRCNGSQVRFEGRRYSFCFMHCEQGIEKQAFKCLAKSVRSALKEKELKGAL
jgi:hypothetical protein